MIDITNRVRCKELLSKICTAEEAAAFIKPGMNVGTSGFKGCTSCIGCSHGERAFQD